MINYYFADFFTGKNLYKKIIQYQKEYPEIFYDNVNIKYIFGNFPNMLWNGGSIMVNNMRIFTPQIIEIKEWYEELNIPLQLTLTNTSLLEKHLEDEFCNNVLQLMDNGKNEVLVSTDLMYNYIKKNYPNYKINRSIVNTEKDYNWEEALDTKYHNIVMPRRNTTPEYLSSIGEQYRNRIELLCNDPCPINCPMINTHYKLYEELAMRRGPDIYKAMECHNDIVNNSFFKMDLSSQITYKDINDIYLPLGYTEFKLSGRGSILKILTAVTSYMVKPEYQVMFYEKLLGEVQ